MCRSGLRILVPLSMAFAALPVFGQTTATIDIDTSTTTPVHPNFSGVNHEIQVPIEFYDARFNGLAATVSYGWARFPGGTVSDAYDWQAGEERPAWVAEFSGSDGTSLTNAQLNIQGKGGAKFIDAAAQAQVLGAGLIVCANGFTDTAQSIGQMAAFAKANNIPVLAWELSNEAYLFTSSFFPTAKAYLDQMKPYRDAIKAVNPNAIVAIFAQDPSNAAGTNAWDQAIQSYSNKYWDAITYHHYGPQSTGPFSQWMTDQTARLVSATSVISQSLAPLGPVGVQFLNTEFDSSISNDPATGFNSITNGTLWGGIYAVEYLMRMSQVPSVLYVGPQSMENYSGAQPGRDPSGQVRTAALAGMTIDTTTLDFQFYLTAQANALAVLNPVINRSTASNNTTVTGGATVPATGIAGGVPALYAMSYTRNDGGLSVVITNKGAISQQLTIRVNGALVTGTLPMQFVSASDPSAQNSFTALNAVAIQTANMANPANIPGYSVVRLDLPVTALGVSGPGSLTSGTALQPLASAQFSATGGAGGYMWSTNSLLPAGVSLSPSGMLSGTPVAGSQGVYPIQFIVTDAKQAIASISLTLIIAAPATPAPAITSINPGTVPSMNGAQSITINGTGFQNSANLKVHVSTSNFSADLTGSSVEFVSATQLVISINVGTATADWTLQVINPDTQVSNLYFFSTSAQAATTTFALPQFAYGGGWYTALYFTNTTGSAATLHVRFIANDGSQLSVPLLLNGSPVAALPGRNVNLNPGATTILEALNSGDLVQGWVEADLPPGVDGYAVFRQSVTGIPDQEAVSPLTPETSQIADFTYDDIATATAVSIVNPGNQAITVTITLRAADGSMAGTSQLSLAARAKQAIALTSLPNLSGANGNQGWANFSTSSGAISVLGLRFSGSAFTSIPVTHRTANVATTAVTYALPQVASGGGWSTTLFFSNTTNAAVSVPVHFYLNGTAQLSTLTMAAGASAVIDKPNVGSLVQEWVDASIPPGVIGYAVFRQSVPGVQDQEAVVPLASESDQTADLIFDETSFVTAAGFVNPTVQPVLAALNAFAADGTPIGSTVLSLGAQSKQAFVLDQLPGLGGIAGQRGWVSFSVASGAIAVLGLRFGGAAFTSIPDTHR